MSIATPNNHPARRRCYEEVNKRAWILHAVASLNKIGEDSCVKRGIFLKSESPESIFLSRRHHELIINTSVRSSSVNPDAIDRRKQMPAQDPEARHLS